MTAIIGAIFGNPLWMALIGGLLGLLLYLFPTIMGFFS